MDGRGANAFATGFMGSWQMMEEMRRKQEESQRAAANDEIINQLRNEEILKSQKARTKQAEWEALNSPKFQSYFLPSAVLQELGITDKAQLSPLGEQRLQGMMGDIPQQTNNPDYNPMVDAMGTEKQPSMIANPAYAQALATNTNQLREKGGEIVQPSLTMEQLRKHLTASEILTAMSKEQKPLHFGIEEKYDTKTKTTFGRDYAQNAQTGEKAYTSDWRPIKGREGVSVSLNSGDETSATAWASAVREGRANLQDVPARGKTRDQVVKILEAEAQGTGGQKVDYVANRADNQGYASAINFQQKQLSSIGSFVKNMDMQVDKVEKLANDLKTFDSRILNLPLRAWRGKIAGSKEQAKYDMYLTEIENEIGKLASGSASSISELSVGAQEKWARIHDKNLSTKDMISLLRETAQAGKLRMKSVEDQLKETREQMRSRGGQKNIPTETKSPPQAAIDYLKKNPKQAIFFDQKYGRGASQRILGGQ